MELTLREFGLTKNETKIYLALLKLGISNPSEIANKTGLSRSYIYDALARLEEKSLVSSVLKNNKKQYDAINPKQLEEKALQQLKNIQKIIPQLEELQNSSKEEIKVQLHKGENAYKIILKDILTTLKSNEEVLIYGVDENAILGITPHYEEHVQQYFSQLQKRNIKERVIITKGNKIFKEAKTTTYRFLDKENIGGSPFEVYENKVGILLLGKPFHFILIENKEIADSYRKQFNLLWKIAKRHS